MVEVLELTAMPATPRLYAKALAPAGRPDLAAGLSERQVRLSGHRSTVGEVAAYDRVCGFVLTDQLPATWLHVLTFPLQLTLMTAPGFPLGLVGLVHVSNSMVQHRPALIGEALDLSVRAENLRPHRRGVLVDLVGEASVAGEPVWQGRSVYLNRQQTLPSAPPAEESSRPARPPAPGGDLGAGSGFDDDARSSSVSFTTPQSSTAAPSSTTMHTAGWWRLPADLGRRYAAVSGDINPIHLNALAAKAFGFQRAIAHGMWTHARVLASLQSRLPAGYEVTVDFLKPVLLPSGVRLAMGRTAQGFSTELTDRAGDKVFLSLTTR